MASNNYFLTLLGFGLLGLTSCSCDKDVERGSIFTDEACESALSYCNQQVLRSMADLTDDNGSIDYTMMPRNILSGQKSWNLRKVDRTEWCSGFWCGVLWYDYEATKDSSILQYASNYSAALEYLSDLPAYDHDLGFLVITSLLNGYRLTGNPTYKECLLKSADQLAKLYNPKVGTILSWPRHVNDFQGHNTIMDNMINLELLFWAAKNGGDPNLREIAIHHADTTMAYQFRPDYTSYHVAIYDTLDGHHLYNCTHQGLSDDSMWARGQSWAIYGYTMVYRETQDPKYLDFAQRVTDVYLKDLPEDMIPYWDFSDPRIKDTPSDSLNASIGEEDTISKFCPKDASAAAIVASALLDLDMYAPDKGYLDYAEKMLASLSTNKYLSQEQNTAFLKHSTGHHPSGSEIDASIVYADYYYIEALLKLQKRQSAHSGKE